MAQLQQLLARSCLHARLAAAAGGGGGGGGGGGAGSAPHTRPLRTFWVLSTRLNSVKVASMGLMLACAATALWLAKPTFGALAPAARCCLGPIEATTGQRVCCGRRPAEAGAAACS